MIKMKVRVHHIANTVQWAGRLFQLGHNSAVFIADRLKCFGKSAPSGKGIFEYIGVGAGIEKHSSVRMRN